ncbi:hypothetical protein I4U23_023193 [Adineta vaga]|nr:hypothetical protein I4U23_023193 [Adineta vaga]
MKRQKQDTFNDYNNNNKKRQKSNITTIVFSSLTRECITTLEDLSNELIYDIFDYLLDHHAFQAFYNLNIRFQNLFLNSTFPIKINISFISKPNLQHYFTHIIKPCTNRIEYFQLSNSCIDPCSLLFSIMKNLTQLSTLILNHIEANYIESMLNHLLSLPSLSSLTIVSIDNIIDKNNIYYKLLRLLKLKYCQLCIELLQCPKSFLVPINEFSTIEYFFINHEISIDQLFILLSYVPQLRRLSLGNLRESKVNQIGKHSINLNHLTNVSLKLDRVPFHELEILVRYCFHQVQVLTIKIQFIGFRHDDRGYIDADRWQLLISTHILNLRIFDFQLSYRGLDFSNERQAFEILINKFNSKFWTEHQWFFDHHHHDVGWSKAAVFYSRNPYKRKDYVLNFELTATIWSTRFDINEDPIHHICIHNTDMIKKSAGKFLKATKLTLCETFEVPRDSIVMDLNHFLPLKQLTQLFIDCHHFSFVQLIELLQFTSNVHTLKLDSIVLYRMKSNSIQQTDLSQLIAKTNIIRKVTIVKEIALEKLQLVVAVFPRIEYLTINLFKQDLPSIGQFLLSKSNNNTRYLSLLCISKQRHDLMLTMKKLIQSKKLLRDYILKVINRKLYLLW